MPDYPEAYSQYLKDIRDVRFRRSAYYERLALLDAGTIALACNILLGHIQGQLKHRYTLSLGLGFLVLALISFLVRNLADNNREALMTRQQYVLRLERTELADKQQPAIDISGKRTTCLENVGVSLTLAGVILMASVVILSLIQK